MRRLLFSTALGLASVTAVATTACAPPTAVHALLQRTACNSTHQPPVIDACVHWVNHNAAWQYPPETEWVGPYMDYTYDLSHGNGAELLP